MSLSLTTSLVLTSSVNYSRSAAEIDELYERRIPAWRWSKTVTAGEQTMHAVAEAKRADSVASIPQPAPTEVRGV